MGLPCGIFNSRPEEDMAIMRTKTQWSMLALGLAFIFTLSLWFPADWLSWLIMLGIYAVAVLGMHIQVGLCGLFSMGHAAFMLVGAYTAAVLGGNLGLNPWITLPPKTRRQSETASVVNDVRIVRESVSLIP